VYELVSGETLETLVSLAGGTLPGARIDQIEIRRIDDSGSITRLSASLEDGSETSIRPGDQVVVRSVSENVKRITLEGAVYGSRLSGESPVQIPAAPIRIDFPYYPGITLLDVLDEVGGPTPLAVTEDSYLRRGSTGEVLVLEIEKLWRSREEKYNVSLMPGDYVLIPIERTEVFVSGAVNGPGAVPYRPGYSVSDYLLLSGGIHPNRGNPNRTFFVNELGEMERTQLTAHVKPGAHIHVDERWLFAADQSVQNFFITTAWVTTIVTTVTTVLDFIFTYVVQNSETVTP
jgi:protein involved in polysaccharide export with SLBB domain